MKQIAFFALTLGMCLQAAAQGVVVKGTITDG